MGRLCSSDMTDSTRQPLAPSNRTPEQPKILPSAQFCSVRDGHASFHIAAARPQRMSELPPPIERALVLHRLLTYLLPILGLHRLAVPLFFLSGDWC